MTRAQFLPSRRAFVGLIGAAALCPRPVRAQSFDSLSGHAFGTTWQIVGETAGALNRLRPALENLFDRVDRQMSPWRHDSTVSRFNAGTTGWQAAEEDVIAVLRTALAFAEQSGGAFDPTVGPLVARWGFGPIEGSDRPDWRGVSVDARGISKTREDLTLDLCGIAKGWALDRAVDLAAEAGFDNLLFDLGGELRALGHHPAGRPWQVAVQHPTPGQDAPAVLRVAAGQAVATSGLRTQSYALAGRTYGHIIDPGTREPADTGLLSVTVAAHDAMTADGWATALFAAGPDAGPAMADRLGLAALFLIEKDGALAQIGTEAIREGLL